jgi:hypothetical protein
VSIPQHLLPVLERLAAADDSTPSEWIRRVIEPRLQEVYHAEGVELAPALASGYVGVQLTPKNTWTPGMDVDAYWSAGCGRWVLGAESRDYPYLAMAGPSGVIEHVWHIDGWVLDQDTGKYRATGGRLCTENAADPTDAEAARQLIGTRLQPQRNPVRISRPAA